MRFILIVGGPITPGILILYPMIYLLILFLENLLILFIILMVGDLVNDKYSEEELDQINLSLSKKTLEKNYATFLTTNLRGKVVLRFCANHPLTTRNEIKIIIEDINRWIEERF